MPDGKPTYVARYVEKFLAQTFLMDAETVGAMVLLEAFAWIQEPPCTLPMDDAALERYAKVAPGRWMVIGPKLIAAFYVAKDGRWFNSDLFEDYKKSLSRMKVNRENGAKGGKARVSQAIAKQSLSKRLATTPSEAQALDRDRDRDRETDREKEPEPCGSAFSDSVEPDPDATWMIAAVAKAIGYQPSSSAQYAIAEEQAKLAALMPPVIGGKGKPWRDVFDAACTMALQTAKNKSAVPFTRYAVEIAKGAISDGIMPGTHRPANNGKVQPGPVLTGKPYRPLARGQG